MLIGRYSSWSSIRFLEDLPSCPNSTLQTSYTDIIVWHQSSLFISVSSSNATSSWIYSFFRSTSRHDILRPSSLSNYLSKFCAPSFLLNVRSTSIATYHSSTLTPALCCRSLNYYFYYCYFCWKNQWFTFRLYDRFENKFPAIRFLPVLLQKNCNTFNLACSTETGVLVRLSLHLLPVIRSGLGQTEESCCWLLQLEPYAQTPLVVDDTLPISSTEESLFTEELSNVPWTPSDPILSMSAHQKSPQAAMIGKLPSPCVTNEIALLIP